MVNDSETEENQKKIRFIEFLKDHYVLSIISIIFIGFILLSPLIFTKISTGIVFDYDVTKISSGISIMSPFIAIAAAIITFAAFWVQYKANVDVRADVNEDREEKRKQQIISRFYEMLQIHRENVKELEWLQNIHLETGENECVPNGKDECVPKKGHRIFLYLHHEFNFIYFVVDSLYPEVDVKSKVKKAYNIFYRNAHDERLDYKMKKKIKNAFQKIEDLDSWIDFLKTECKLNFKEEDDVIRTLNMLILYKDDYFKYQPPFSIHFEELNNYYRHLFLTVKTVANEDEKYLSYNEKRDFLRILRVQLTNTEQIMLFYNWFSGNGIVWEEDDPNGNHFFTQYRMVHNIIPKRFLQICLLDGRDKAVESLINYLKKQPIYSFIKEYCSKDDPMFEFEDWEGCPKFDYDK